jgi:hypothetical protein
LRIYTPDPVKGNVALPTATERLLSYDPSINETAGPFPQGLVQEDIDHQASGFEVASSMLGAPAISEAPTSADVSKTEDVGKQNDHEGLNRYKTQIASVFENIKKGFLQDAAQTLLRATIWLLKRVESLGKRRETRPSATD